MSGIAFTIPAAATDLSLPKLLDHPEMAEGTVFLFDPNHAYGTFAGVPGNGGVLPNVASRNAQLIIPGATLSELDGVIATASEGSSMMQLERTTKGAIHVMLSRTAMITGVNNYIARLPTKIRQAIFDLIAQATDGVHGLYFSHWYRTTRAGGSLGNAVSWMHFATAVGVNPAIFSTAGGIITAGGNLGSLSAAHALGTANVLGGGASAWSGTKPGALGQVSALFAAGPTDGWTFGGNKNLYPSRAYHRAKVEFLHLNKRANGGAGGTLAEEFAAAVAADQAAFNAAFALGGALYGDTFSDPATAVP